MVLCQKTSKCERKIKLNCKKSIDARLFDVDNNDKNMHNLVICLKLKILLISLNTQHIESKIEDMTSCKKMDKLRLLQLSITLHILS